MKKKVICTLLTGLALASVLCGTAAPAKAAEPSASASVQTAALNVSSYKGCTLSAGDRSMVMISPYGTSVTASSSNPGVIALEQVDGRYVMAAKSAGTAVISVTDKAGNTAAMTMTVGGGKSSPTPPVAASPAPAQVSEDSNPVVNSEWFHNPDADLSANMDIRLKMVEYINQVRRENGRSELPVNEALMNTAQDVSTQCVTEHRPYDHMALLRYGWPHGGMFNLTRFGADDDPDIAKRAVNNWVNSPGHFETMLLEEASCVGAGVTFDSGRVYCYMVVGDPTAHNPYE